MQKTFYVLLIFSLLFSVAPLPSSYAANKDNRQATEENTTMDIYSDSEGKEPLLTIPNQTEITLLETGEEFSKISFIDPESNQTIVGYLSTLIVSSLTTPTDNIIETTIPSLPIDEKTDKQSIAPSIQPTEQQKAISAPASRSIQKSVTVVAANATIKGVALKSPTNIYQTRSTGSSVLKSYAQREMTPGFP